MNKRDFLKVAASTATLAVVAAAPALARGTELPRTLEPEREYQTLAGIEVIIIDMVGDSQRTVLSTSNKPILVPEAKRPFALVLTEHDDEQVGMMLLERNKNGRWTKVTRSYAGHVSTQVLRKYGVVLQIIATPA
ncbi:MAG: hypothetical protein KIS72_02485 [Luteimonas sp.]|nr:hypothetical protein [Luteimonas sp.]